VLIILAASPPDIWAAPDLRAAPALWKALVTTDAPDRDTRLASPGRLNGTGAVFHITWQASCETPPAEAMTALEYAAGLWGTWISSTVPIEVSSCWTSVLNCDGDALACGGPTGYLRNFAGAPLMDTSYTVSLANALSGDDLDSGGVDITLHFLAGADWSFATTTPAPTGYDFVDVALHEIAHGLGFTGNMYESYSVGFCGNGPLGFLYPCPTPYDWFAVDDQGIPLLNYLSSNPIELGTHLENDANFGGPNTVVANDGIAAKLYTPQDWDQGSSLSHLDPTTFETGENRLMTPSYNSAVRHPGPVTLAILQDMGWRRADGAPNVATSGPQVVVVGHDAVFGTELDWIGHTGQAITYTWTVADRDVITHTARGITDSATLSWTVPGPKTIGVTAVVSGTPASATRSVLVVNETLFLPLVQRH
jgi:hypothetical protein